MSTRAKVLFFCVLLLSLPVIAQAQTTIDRGPVPAGARFEWSPPANITSAAEAQTFEPRILIDSIPATALTGVTCAPAATSTAILCTSVISQSNRDALNLMGRHEMRLRLFRGDVGEGEVSSPFFLTTRAGAPTGLRIIP